MQLSAAVSLFFYASLITSSVIASEELGARIFTVY